MVLVFLLGPKYWNPSDCVVALHARLDGRCQVKPDEMTASVSWREALMFLNRFPHVSESGHYLSYASLLQCQLLSFSQICCFQCRGAIGRLRLIGKAILPWAGSQNRSKPDDLGHGGPGFEGRLLCHAVRCGGPILHHRGHLYGRSHVRVLSPVKSPVARSSQRDWQFGV